ncbi:MAG: aspartate aminotransferase, partial [Candidatus Delongbacteria bacterium]|nr:aspartate aminotransferase [Candidatus Delongbacteria bacterium]
MLKKLAKRNRVITRSKTLAVAAKAGKLKKQGEDIITLTVGEPDFPTPLNIKETAFQAIKENFTRYTGAGGTDELKQAVVDKYKKDFDVDITLANVIVSNGAKHSIVNVVLSICDPGD